MLKKIRSLDSFYTIIDKSIKLAEAHTDYEDLAFLIKMCRLKPHDILTGKLNKKTIFYKWWVDEHSNSLKIGRNKKLKLVLNDPKIKAKLIGTDLYGCLPLDKVAKMSKLLYLLVGKDKQQKAHAVVAFLGIDNFLRSFVLIDEEWQRIAPLQLGLNVLNMLARSHRIKRNYKRLSAQQTIIHPCVKQESWIGLWGEKNMLVSEIKQYQCIVDALKIKGE